MIARTDMPGVSIVVCCYNSSEVIVPTVQALVAQEIPDGLPVELVLVDNRCTDDTVDLVRRHWDPRKGDLRVVREERPGLMFARLAGVEEVRFEHLMWVDDDNILAPGWIVRACEIFATHPSVAAMGGNNHARLHGPEPEWFRRFEETFACGSQGKESGVITRTRKRLFGAGLAFRTEVIREVLKSEPPLLLVGPTRRQLLRGDDSEICMRCVLLGWDLWYDEGLNLEHNLLPRRVNWNYVREARTGGAAAYVILRMYSRLIDGKTPPTLLRAWRDAFKLWRRYLRRRFRKGVRRGEGSELDIDGCVVRGCLRGLWKLSGSYGKIRRRLLAAFVVQRVRIPPSQG